MRGLGTQDRCGQQARTALREVAAARESGTYPTIGHFLRYATTLISGRGGLRLEGPLRRTGGRQTGAALRDALKVTRGRHSRVRTRAGPTTARGGRDGVQVPRLIAHEVAARRRGEDGGRLLNGGQQVVPAVKNCSRKVGRLSAGGGRSRRGQARRTPALPQMPTVWLAPTRAAMLCLPHHW